MSDWPPLLSLPNNPVVITTRSGFLGPAHNGGVGSIASATWPANSLAIYQPVLIPTLMTVAQLFCLNGATASGNIDLGLYDISGTRLVSSGATAQSGTSVYQVVNVTDTQVGPGIYYIGLSLSSTVGTIFRGAPTGAYFCSLVGLAQQASAHPLPATATFAAAANAYIPLVGLTDRTIM